MHMCICTDISMYIYLYMYFSPILTLTPLLYRENEDNGSSPLPLKGTWSDLMRLAAAIQFSPPIPYPNPYLHPLILIRIL
jgi:hypothetical protein